MFSELEVNSKRAQRTLHLNGHDLIFEIIVHSYSYMRYKPLHTEKGNFREIILEKESVCQRRRLLASLCCTIRDTPHSPVPILDPMDIRTG